MTEVVCMSFSNDLWRNDDHRDGSVAEAMRQSSVPGWR
ncbi:Hypothetical protein (plasmid) [Pseudomonas putida]|nr:Hypothetical protein [Pseudomonas putida]